MQQALTNPDAVAKERKLTFPIKLRCTSPEDLCSEPGLEAALMRAIGRAFAKARRALPAAVATGAGVVLKAPVLVRPGAVSGGDAATILERVRRAVVAAASAKGLPLATHRQPARAMSKGAASARPALEVSETFDPARYDATRSTYEIPAYDGAKKQATVTTKKDPLQRINELLDQAIALLDAFIDDQEKFGSPQPDVIKALKLERDNTDTERDLLRRSLPLSAPTIAQREQSLEATLTLFKLVRPRVLDLNADARKAAVDAVVAKAKAIWSGSGATKSDSEYLVEADIELSNTFLALLSIHAAEEAKWAAAVPITFKSDREAPTLFMFKLFDEVLKDAFERFAFLDAYYSDPTVVMGIAEMRYAAGRLTEIWDQLGKVRPKLFEADQPPSWPQLENTPIDPNIVFRSARTNSSGTPPPQLLNIVLATRQAAQLHRFLSHAVTMPKSLSEVGPTPPPWAIKQMAALLFHLQIEVLVFALWQNLPNARLLTSKFKVSPPGIEPEISRLEDAFIKEIGSTDPTHEGIEQRAADWERDVKKLYDTIITAVKHDAYTKAFISFALGLVLTFGVSAWLQIAITGSKVALILAEGVALTAINTGLAAIQGATPDITHIGVDLVFNTALVGLGPVLKSFKTIAQLEEQLARARPLLTALGEGVAMIGVTTAGQLGIAKLLDDEASRQGGETSSTEMLTLSLIFNTVGMLVGLSASRFTKVPKGELAITPELLVKRLRDEANIEITAESAKKLIDLQGEIGTFQKALQEVQAAARKGTLTEDQYKMWQARGESLIAQLEDIPDLGKLIGGGDIQPAEMQAILSRMKALLRRPFQAGLLLATPEALGLVRIGEGGRTWVYDPDRTTDPKRFDKLKDRFKAMKGVKVVEPLEGGGWAAVEESTGRTLIQVLPAGRQVAGLLEPPLRGMFGTDRAQAGADLVESQTAAPELGSLVKRLAKSNRATAQKILEAISRPGGSALTIGDGSAWRGLANYLRQGGDPARLALVLTFREGTISAETNNRYARGILALLDGRSSANFPTTSRLLSFTGKATQEGLAAAQSQPFAENLEVLLEAAAAKSPNAVKTLLPTLRLLNPKDSTPWVGLQRYLAWGGDVGVLNRSLGFRGSDVGQFRPDLVNQAMEIIASWPEQSIRGLATYERLNATAQSKGRRYANLFVLRTEDPKGVASALADLAALEPKIDTKDPTALAGVRKVLNFLSAEDTPAQVEQAPGGKLMAKPTASLGNAPNITGAVGALRAGAVLAREFPGSNIFLRFESPHEVVNPATGEVLGRIYDIVVIERGDAPGPGKLPPPDKIIGRVEVKEITSTASLATPRVRKELAADILADVNLRAAVQAGQPSPPPFSATRWMIRANEIRAQAITNLKQRDPNFSKNHPSIQEQSIDEEMRNAVRKALAPALSDSSLAGLDLTPYRQLLGDPRLPFVVFVDGLATAPQAGAPAAPPASPPPSGGGPNPAPANTPVSPKKLP
jgi:hypothetical protein